MPTLDMQVTLQNSRTQLFCASEFGVQLAQGRGFKEELRLGYCLQPYFAMVWSVWHVRQLDT